MAQAENYQNSFADDERRPVWGTLFNKKGKKLALSLLGTTGVRIVLALLVLGGIQTVSAFDQSMRATAYVNFKNAFWNANGGGPGYFINQQGFTSQQMSFWTMAETIEVVEDAVIAGQEQFSMITAGCQNFTNNFASSWVWNSFNDDLGWAAMAFCRAYEMTGNKQWLALAKSAADTAWSRGWDPVNGGIYQQGSSGGKCTCANCNNGEVSYMLYQCLGDPTYLSKAQMEYAWIKTNDFNPSTGAVEQGPGSQIYFTYDNGGWATLCLDMGDTNSADKTFDWVTNQYGTAMESFGQGSDAGGFNGIGLRGLARTGHNIPFLQACCDRAFSDTNSLGLTSVSFGSQTASGTQLWCWDCSDMVVAMMDAPLPAPSASGGNIPILLVNSGFETNTSGAVFTTKVSKGYDVSSENVAGWLNAGPTYTDSGVDYAGDNGNVAHLGNVLAYCDQGDSGAYQITGYQMNAGDLLTLTWWAKSSAGNANQSVKLLKAASTSSAYGSLTQLAVSDAALNSTGVGGAFTKYTLTYTATAPDAGNYVAISFMAPGTPPAYASFDDFALTVSTIPNGIYNIVCQESGLALDDPGGGGSGTGMDQQASGCANQRWVVTSVGAGQYRIVSAVNGLALSGPTPSNQLVIQDYTGSSNQLWTFTTNGSSYIIGDMGSGEVMDDSASSISAGNPIDQLPANGETGQNWALTLLNYGTNPIPGAPMGLRATALNASVALSWSSSPSATGYNVKRSSTSGGETTIGNVSGTFYLDAAPVNGTKYYYEVSATNFAGESASSSEVNATPMATPTGLSAVAMNAAVTLTWGPGAGATSYNVKRSTISDAETIIANVSGTGYTNTGLANGATYYYEVSGVVSASESPNSSEVSTTPHIGSSIILVNSGFETNTSGVVFTTKVNQGYDVSGNDVAGWLNAGTTYSDSGVDYAGDNGEVTHSGTVLAYCDQGDSGTYQITDYQMNAGDLLTLTWWAKGSAGNASQNVKFLSATGASSAYGSLTPLSISAAALNNTGNGGAFTKYTLTYTATASDVGHYVAVSFMAPGTPGSYAEFDDFALTVSALSAISNGTYNIVCQESGLALDDPDSGGNVTGIDQQASGGADQKWVVAAVGSGQYKIISALNGLALSGPTLSNQLVTQSYSGANNQLWTFTANGPYYIIGNAGSDQVIDDSASSTSAGNPIGQWPANGGINQNWALMLLNLGTNPIPVMPRPQITGISLNGTTLTVSGMNGFPGGTYYLLMSTNAAIPMSQWTPILTNAFDGQGNLSLSTNIVRAGDVQEFYVLHVAQ